VTGPDATGPSPATIGPYDVPGVPGGCPPRAAPPEDRHRRGDRAARRGRRPGRAPGRCALPAAGPGVSAPPAAL